ncbi:TPA: response regulator transcription factor [Vibrio parahaemolyticus]|uniref:response regulator transcription factor n=1 Tax=Vibrio parahaemolyticus TaxID=670 RepID=UPI00111F8EF2|nr:response regulator [Vibrio parahaemolyticus]EJG0323131.1 response regulator transcription factor [Vibrio parahaemolyticus]EKA7362767.1 response regulator transcription factor [Vibrio parahaemolyticus]ELA8196399.1 response regulator transcription factor [Vibrio parahaemolyticus]MBE3904061.1 response regulator transcription factor [Vibrio parahaemolyticus]MDB6193813.1 response regulator transcription factor [Vibrio parahaemolyticus]
MSRNLCPLYIVDDEVPVLESMAFMLESYGYSVDVYSSGQDFLQRVNLHQAGCVLLDSRMPEMRGQELHLLMRNQCSPISVIYLTGHGDIPMAVDALKEGALDFFQKPVDGNALVVAIDNAMECSLKNQEKQSAKLTLQSLTRREKEVLILVVKGMKNQDMANQLCVSLRTIEVHRSNVMKKLEVESLAALIHKVGHVI